MVRLYLPFFLALFILAVPREAAGQNGSFTDVSEVAIQVEELNSQAKNLGLDETAIKNHVLVLLRTKLPRLLVEDSALSRVHINVDVGDIRTGSEVLAYYGSVSMGVTRMVTIMETRKVTLAFLYNSTIRITGPPSRTSENVRGVLDQLLTGFAAAWYQDNP